ncbi:MAG: acyl carrier protein [Epsilonproteobacteria bacterium]|nr:acyl carrier protein [Campylobacterota bacterium]
MVTTEEIKQKLIDGLNLEDMTPEDINDSDALFNEGLGLDSVDAIELIVILDNEYGIKFENMSELKDIFATIQSLADYVNKNKK